MPACPTHPEAATTTTCSACERAVCAACITHEVDGKNACETCGRGLVERGRVLGGTLILLVAAAYLVTFAIAYLIFHARPFVGALAAVIAIVLSRTIQSHVYFPVVIPHPTPNNE